MRIPSAPLALLLGSLAAAQHILLPPGPATAGAPVQVTLVNDTPGYLGVPCGMPVWMQHADGSVVVFPDISDCIILLPPSGSTDLFFPVPATGPGSQGSFVLRWNAAAARIDVGAPSPSFPAIHGNPAGVIHRFGGHSTGPLFAMDWEVSNTGWLDHTFGAGDLARIFTPGGTAPLATVSLEGATALSGRAVTASLPLQGLAPGPYSVEMTWHDPETNTVISTRHGIQFDGGVDVQLPGGHVIPTGDVLPVALSFAGFPPGGLVVYAFCIGVAPGSTPAAGAGLFPLAVDQFVMASVTNGIGGLLIANVGEAIPDISPYSAGGAYTATGIGITHPGVGFSGMTVRAAASGYDAAAAFFGVSQGEDLLIQ